MHPVLVNFHGITIYAYGLCVALGVALSLVLAAKRAPAEHLSPGTAVDLLFISFIAGMAGARLFYVVQHWADYRPRWISVFWIQEGGLVWYGGFIFAMFAGLCYCRQRRLPVPAWADFFAPLVALAQSVGRVGCFLNGCCYGRPTDFFLGVRFPNESVSRHPVQLYESFGLLAIAGALFWIASKKTRDGEVIASYLLLYGALRFGLEFLRGDQQTLYFLTPPQWISAGLVLSALYFLRTLRVFPHENKH